LTVLIPHPSSSRCWRARPDFQITKRNAPTIAELCHRLEGIPLAIELAAARAQTLAPSQMLAQLQRRFDFLTSKRRDVSERHRTLRAAARQGDLARARALFRASVILEPSTIVLLGIGLAGLVVAGRKRKK
jgi:predicted ATPase